MVRLNVLGLEQQGGEQDDLQRKRQENDRHLEHAKTGAHECVPGRSLVSVHGGCRQAIRKAAEERV